MTMRLLQAIAITAAVYLTMMTYESSRSPSIWVSTHSPVVGAPVVRADRLPHLLAEVLNLLLTPTQRGAARHSANLTPHRTFD